MESLRSDACPTAPVRPFVLGETRRPHGDILLHTGATVEYFSSQTGQWTAYRQPRPAKVPPVEPYPMEADEEELSVLIW